METNKQIHDLITSSAKNKEIFTSLFITIIPQQLTFPMQIVGPICRGEP